ncbi:MAG: DUF3054 domain-containing protein [Austwickia sp.]|jgi:hypothetical protein|nr:DUF3054 domain-containing protein [Austwickia sp.]MBK8435295.1 DUF3054 domain-containing protein [Austwickia sp.]MBK9101154.1 DUF3054 domain-containing protein [Austwickia sp.]
MDVIEQTARQRRLAAPGYPLPPWAGFLLDMGLILVFAAIGRGTHAEPVNPLGVFGTAWPFMVGTAFGWALVWRIRKIAPLNANDGVLVWLATFAVGMPLRVITGAGTAVPFVLVTMVATAILLLGWRFVADQVVTRGRY